MISKDCLTHLRRLAGTVGPISCRNALHRPATRTMATVNDIPPSSPPQTPSPHTITRADDQITTTIYSFPTMEPLHFAYYPHSHLYLPLRRDILHKAVIYEADNSRQGTASTKWRDEVHGSHHKVHPQKGLGKARVGDKQSPIRRGGGVAFGPKPRDFSTALNRKVYDLAWRTALSYRYRRGQLFLVDQLDDLESSQDWYLKQVFRAAQLEGSLLVTAERKGSKQLFRGLDKLALSKKGVARIRDAESVDVKNLLEMKRVVIEKAALDLIFKNHSSDLGRGWGKVSSQLPPVLDFAGAQADEPM